MADVLAARLASLSDEARHFLEALAVCARPMAPDVVCDACGVGRDRQSLIAALRSSRLIRSRGSSAQIETYHDRIREALAASVDAEGQRRMHGRLAEALIARRVDDCEALRALSRRG